MSDKTPDFGVHALPLTSTQTLSLGPMRDDHPNSIDLRKKSELLFLSLSSHFPSFTPFSLLFSHFLSFLFSFSLFNLTYFKLSLICDSHGATCHTIFARIRSHPKTIYLFSVQFILIELSLSHFLTSKIFVNISSLKSLATHHPKNKKNSDCLRIKQKFSGSLDFARRI